MINWCYCLFGKVFHGPRYGSHVSLPTNGVLFNSFLPLNSNTWLMTRWRRLIAAGVFPTFKCSIDSVTKRNGSLWWSALGENGEMCRKSGFHFSFAASHLFLNPGFVPSFSEVILAGNSTTIQVGKGGNRTCTENEC